MQNFDSKSESDLINTEAKEKAVELMVEEPSVDLEVESQVVEELPVDLEINNQGANQTFEEPSVDLETEKEVKEFVEKLKQKSVNTSKNGQKLSFLLTGRTGVGKSSTINFLMGKEIAPVGDYGSTELVLPN